jgi:hypothetical protein
MTIALVLFAVAALGGVVMALMRFKGKPYPPLGLALVHGAVAAAGLVTLIALVVQGQGTSSSATTSLVLFVVAALGGFGLFFHHLRKVALPVWLVIVHALVAVVAFVMLLISVL